MSFKLFGLWYFCYSSLNRLRQYIWTKREIWRQKATKFETTASMSPKIFTTTKDIKQEISQKLAKDPNDSVIGH